jgi:hypothetical protein
MSATPTLVNFCGRSSREPRRAPPASKFEQASCWGERPTESYLTLQLHDRIERVLDSALPSVLALRLKYCLDMFLSV